tara:strand:- start:218 stop:376 length:159 start_codon:yes stop_codon:yes gene_type:complete
MNNTNKNKLLLDLCLQIESIKYEIKKMDKYNLDNDDIIMGQVEELIKIYDNK